MSPEDASRVRLRASVHLIDETRGTILFDTATGRGFRAVGVGSSAEGWLSDLRAGTLPPSEESGRAALLRRLVAAGFADRGDGEGRGGEPAPGAPLTVAALAEHLDDDVCRRRTLEIVAGSEAEQRGVALALTARFDGAPPPEWRRVTVDVGDRPVDDRLLAAAGRFPVRILVRGGDRSRRLVERQSGADLCEAVRLPTSTAEARSVMATAAELAVEGRSVAVRLEPEGGSDSSDVAVEDAWRHLFADLTEQVADVELEGGASAASVALWEPVRLRPWSSALRRAWDLELLRRIGRWESATTNPTRFDRWQRVYAGFADVLGRRLRLPPDARIADLGGATGFASLALQRGGEVGPFRASVFDLDGVAVASGRHRGDGHLDLRSADALRLPTGEATFDAVILVGAIDSFLEPNRLRALLGECRRVLRQGGRLAVVHPQLWGTSSAELFVHVNHPELVRLLESHLPDAGFVIEERLLHGEIVAPADIGSTRLVHLPTNARDEDLAVFDSAPVNLYLVARRR